MRSRSRPWAGLLVVCLLCAGLMAGCRASKPFVEGVRQAVPLLDRDVRHYAGGDRDRLAQADGLQAAARDVDLLTADTLDAAWSPVKAWYAPAFEADASLTEPKKAIRRSAVRRLDTLIDDERRRPFRLP